MLGASARFGSAVPLVADQAPLGALWLGFDERRSLAPADQRLASAYADLAAGAIVRLRLGAVRQLLLAANEAERARLESVLRQMPIGVILAAVPDGRLLYANEAARRLLPMPMTIGAAPAFADTHGYRPDGSEVAEDQWPLRRAMRGETVENDVVELVAGDGSRRLRPDSGHERHDRGGRRHVRRRHRPDSRPGARAFARPSVRGPRVVARL